MAGLIYLLLFLILTGHSSASYCLCKDGVGDQALQKSLDYACGAGADCTPILQNGACYNPNTVKDHCNWAVNSYYQRKGQGGASCDFSGTATLSSNPPTNVPSTCSYTSSASTTTPTTGATTPTTGATTPTAGTTTPTTSTSTTPSVFGTGLGPTGSGIGDNSDAASYKIVTKNLIFGYLAFCSGLLLLRG